MKSRNNLKPKYVCGFLFQDADKLVVLIKSAKPGAPRFNQWNGVGGRIEENETPVVAMVREFSEETGIRTAPLDWSEFFVAEFSDCIVHFFKSFDYGSDLGAPTQTTDEPVLSMPVEIATSIKPYTDRFVENLVWLIPLALHTDNWFHAVSLRHTKF
jgi:8-oxo-dGTP pyrophosphatase MutT (NUDIX family)